MCSSTMKAVLEHAAEHMRLWSEAKAIKAASAVAQAQWEQAGGQGVVQSCFTLFGFKVLENSRLANLAAFLME